MLALCVLVGEVTNKSEDNEKMLQKIVAYTSSESVHQPGNQNHPCGVQLQSSLQVPEADTG